MSPQLISLVGLAFGLIGSGILAFGLSPLLEMLKTSADATEMSTHQLAQGADVGLFIGLDKHRAVALQTARRSTQFGFGFLVLSFLLQTIGLIAS